jgi:hypothetical protein
LTNECKRKSSPFFRAQVIVIFTAPKFFHLTSPHALVTFYFTHAVIVHVTAVNGQPTVVYDDIGVGDIARFIGK